MTESRSEAGPAKPDDVTMMTIDAVVEPWPEADRLFTSDPLWLGGDDAYSFPLGDDRHLWVFGDSLIRYRGGDRSTSHFIHNTVAIQTGSDPSTATMEFHWHGTDEWPQAVFTDDEEHHFLWPGDGVVVDDRLLLFFMRVASGPHAAPLPPDADHVPLAGWRAAIVDDVQASPRTWTPRLLPIIDVPFVETLGAGGVWIEGDHLYAHAFPALPWRGTTATGQFVVRWPLAAALEGDLTGMTWWHDDAWVATDEVDEHPDVVIEPPMTEFTVHPEGDGWIATQLIGINTGEVNLRTASHPLAGWSDPQVVHTSPYVVDGDNHVVTYAAKSHPDVRDDHGHLVTYCTNARSLATVHERNELYVPHCLRRRT